ncbi:MAG: M4 family metallopeptidase [Phycisphaerales bacterium]|nr:MAG: M4 family metallopeptidase [Phycisphaerales bacterium]
MKLSPVILTGVILMSFSLRTNAAPPTPARLQLTDENVAKTVNVQTSRATGVARFVTARDRGAIDLALPVGQDRAQPADFLEIYGGLFGVGDSAKELVFEQAEVDEFGYTHTSYQQVHDGVPVFAGSLRIHANAAGEIIAANGTFVPDIRLSTVPVLSANEADVIAVDHVANQLITPAGLAAIASRLLVFRTNLARGLPGIDHLVYEVEVGNGYYIREFVYVDAHKGSIVDQITGICTSLNRIVYNQFFDAGSIIWSEGDPQPYGDVDVDNIIDFTEDTYNLVASTSNGTFLSWDGVDGTMHAVHDDVTIGCPNAHWTGSFTGYCPGVDADDTVGHEWGHAYTDSTHNLIYQWQPGALNEAYADIYGEVVDFLNGAGTDSPAPVRSPGDCSMYARLPAPTFTVNSPPSIAGTYFAGGATFNPLPPWAVTGDVELADDGDDEGGTASVTDACQPLIGFTAGNLALLDLGTCSFRTQTTNAQAAGASGVIIVNDIDYAFEMWDPDPGLLGIPSVMIGVTDGDNIRAELPGVSVTLELNVNTADSLRWLSGEDVSGFGGPIRDLWNPTCLGAPGKVSDTQQYWCYSEDGGGVHTNSGVPNHGFALLVDGGTFNGQTINGIGLTKAFHIYWRAQTVYQVEASDFADHADALEQSCVDLLGVDLYALSTEVATGSPSGQIITPADCDEVAKTVAAVELRLDPTFCNFAPMLDPNAPPLCEPGETTVGIFNEDWESGLGFWSTGTREVVNPDTFDTPDWAVVGGLPDGRTGSAAFVADPVIGDCAADTEAGVLYLESPTITIPAGVTTPKVEFSHWVATEFGYDGGNVKISVNGDPYEVVPAWAFDFNPPPTSLYYGDNPLGGEDAFTGTDGGAVDGSWGQSQIDLTGIATGGDTIRLRFEMGLDGCNGVHGWYVDELSIFFCASYAAPALPPAPHDARKNRYISIDPSTNADNEVAYKVELVEMMRCAGDLRRTCSVDADCPNVCDNDSDISCTGDAACSGGTCVPTEPCVHHPAEGLTRWVQDPQQEPLGCRLPGGCTDEDWFARLNLYPHFRTWNDFGVTSSALLHISDCEITPVARYEIRACAPPTGDVCTDPLVIATILRPPPGNYGDVVGPVDPVTMEFDPPNQILSVGDISGYLLTNQNYGLPGDPKPQAHWTWVDLEGQGAPFYRPQAILNVGDLNQILFGIMGRPYSWAGNNVDPGDCP